MASSRSGLPRRTGTVNDQQEFSSDGNRKTWDHGHGRLHRGPRSGTVAVTGQPNATGPGSHGPLSGPVLPEASTPRMRHRAGPQARPAGPHGMANPDPRQGRFPCGPAPSQECGRVPQPDPTRGKEAAATDWSQANVLIGRCFHPTMPGSARYASHQSAGSAAISAGRSPSARKR